MLKKLRKRSKAYVLQERLSTKTLNTSKTTTLAAAARTKFRPNAPKKSKTHLKTCKITHFNPQY